MTYLDILSCWHKLEHFSPASLPKDATYLDEIIPWDIPLKSKDEKKRIEYTIYLGVFHSLEVTNFVKKHFKDESKDENERNSLICCASIKVEEGGKFLMGSFGISTLPWALGQLEKGKISSNSWKSDFNEIEEKLNTELEHLLISRYYDDDGTLIQKPKKITRSGLETIQTSVVESFEWSVKPEWKICIKTEEKYFSKDSEDEANPAEILNSFYINDLELILSNSDSKKYPRAFKRYLDGCLGQKSDRIDLSANHNILKDSLRPNNYPDGCWPSQYTLSLMQQYAVNELFKLSEHNTGGISSVNGPPGTGKTTLLRDIIAPILVARAKEMVAFDIPGNALTKVGSVTNSGGSSFPIYSPHETIASGGIVVASSNNGAVENISKELPLKKEVSIYADKIGYFRRVSESCIDQNNWGLISAVLGNSENRSKLISTIWFGKNQPDLQKTLKESIVTTQEWESLRNDFKEKLEEVRFEKNKLERARSNCILYSQKVVQKDRLENEKKRINKKLNEIKTRLNRQNEINVKLSGQKENLLNELSILKSTKPGFFTYWFNKAVRKNYRNALKSSLVQFQKVNDELQDNLQELAASEKELTEQNGKLSSTSKELNMTIEHLQGLKKQVDEDRAILKNNYADDDFWKNIESAESQAACPWYSDTLKKLQSELFILGLNVNEKFVLLANENPRRITTTLIAFFEYLKGDITVSNEEAKCMWNTFFLVIPVVSTTFASAERMFRGLDKEDLPWLFIDEAGQAIPQAAAGSIWRSKRVAVVGDPLQIEPVVTIPKTIINHISDFFGLTQEQIHADLSVQSMADRSNPQGAYLIGNGTDQWIGIPLRVHRRCLDPMFSIANRIAYGDSMYSATSLPPFVKTSFSTQFIDCKGEVSGRHFVQQQASIIREIILHEIEVLKEMPNVFVISPFAEIAFKLNETLYRDLFNEARKNIPNLKGADFGKWLKTHIGTVHTFQGKQAEGVILCLGLDNKTKGAANWASKKPNILNVALTRAKYRFIAVGDSSIWLTRPYFKELKNLLVDANG